MSTEICIKDYDKTGYLKNDTDKSRKVYIKKGDKIEWDNQGCLWFNAICFGLMDAYPVEYFKF